MSLRAAAIAAVLIAGCRSTPKAGPVPNDAGNDAAPASSGTAAVDAGPGEKRDPTLVAVAEGTWSVLLSRTLDGRIVVTAGGVPYEAKVNGALEPLVAPAAYAALHPDDDTFVGYVEPSLEVSWVHGELGTPGPLLIDGHAGKRKTFAVKDGKLTAAPALEARHVVRFRGKLLGGNIAANTNQLSWIDDKAAPAPVAPKTIPTITGMAVDAQGTLVVFGHAPYEAMRAAIYPATASPGDAPVVIDGAKSPSCSLVPSFDGSVVARCGTDKKKFFRVAASGFEPIFPDAPDGISAASIGKDGALYVTFLHGISAQRCPAPVGKCTELAIAKDFGVSDTVHYEADVTDAVERKGEFDIGDRSWSTIRLEGASAKEPITGGSSILARSEDDVWITFKSTHRTLLVHTTDDAKRARVRLPSRLDSRFIMKNTKEPQPWTAHCEQVFVRLGATNADEIAKRSPEIEKALGATPETYDSAFHWWVVEGKLHDDPVVGVVIVHRDVEEPLDKMERAIDRLITAFSPNPVSKPSAYCTLPVLERRLHPSGT